MKTFIFNIVAIFFLVSCSQGQQIDSTSAAIVKSDKEWKTLLSPQEYHVLREKGTERAFTGKYNKFYKEGTYICKGCQNPLFISETKYDSGSGWPSYYTCIEGNVEEIQDNSHGMNRVEVVCNRCKGHLGHVFTDGPQPTGLRYCINSVSLSFKEKE